MINSDEPKGVNLIKTQPTEPNDVNLMQTQQQPNFNNMYETSFEARFDEVTETVSNIVENLVGNATEVVNNLVGNAAGIVYNILENAMSSGTDIESTGNQGVPYLNQATPLKQEINNVANLPNDLNVPNIANVSNDLNVPNVVEVSAYNTEVVEEKPREENTKEEKPKIVLDLRKKNDENKAPIEENISEADSVQPLTTVKHLSDEAVTTHTANLWKYLPVPVCEPEPAPEYIHREYQFPKSRAVASRVRGKKHKHDGTNCDDWYEVANYQDITIVAVSDGAGSKKFSRIGARESCRSSVGYLVKAFEEQFKNNPDLQKNLMLELSEQKCIEACSLVAGIVQNSVVKAYEAVEANFYSRLLESEYSKTLNRELQFKDFSGTLLIAVIIPVSEETKEHLVITCQIGDGMIALLNSEGEFESSSKLMGEADSGEFSGETDFLTSPKMKNLETLQSRTKISRCIVDTILVMSDGVADDYFPNETQIRRLYFDLIVNGIIDSKKAVSKDCLSIEQMRLFKKIPDPLVYPWVNDQNVKIALQYTKRISESTGLSLEDIWKDDTVLALARLELNEQNKIEDRSERLKVWLDNYVERGSFDDRTLVVVQM